MILPLSLPLVTGFITVTQEPTLWLPRATTASSKFAFSNRRQDERQLLQLYSTPTTATQDSHVSKAVAIQVAIVQGAHDPRVMDVAAFRKHGTNPNMMAPATTQAKRNSLNIPQEILHAIVIGYVMAGPIGAALQYMNNQNIQDSIIACRKSL
jgi:hypothetical protein